eukprot:4603867-Prymnesium_polylepis.1
MLQDTVRTSLYQFAILENKEDFADKRVLDVGAGTGILSFFAAHAGAKKVYAVEASGMAKKAEKLAAGNGLGDVVAVVNERVEDVVRAGTRRLRARARCGAHPRRCGAACSAAETGRARG